MRIELIIAVLAAVPAVLEAQATVATPVGAGSVTGAVADTSGKAVNGALVTANLIPSTRPLNFKPVGASAISDSAGHFTMNNLAPGVYSMCVEKPGTELLNPCLWADHYTAAIVKAGEATSVQITAVEGVTITVRVADPASVLAQNPSLDDILIGVMRPMTPFLTPTANAKDPSGKTFSMVVPMAKAVNLSVFSSHFALADQNGVAFASQNATVAVPASSTAVSALASGGLAGVAAGKPATVTLQIKGLGK